MNPMPYFDASRRLAFRERTDPGAVETFEAPRKRALRLVIEQAGEQAGPPVPLIQSSRTVRGAIARERKEAQDESFSFAIALVAVSGTILLHAQAPASRSSADPYANNPDAGKMQFPLAAPAGKDSGAITNAPPGRRIRERSIQPTGNTGTRSTRRNAKIWNPVKLKMMRGEKVTGGTVFSSDSPETYCAMANAGYDFIWTEMQHDSRDWEAVGRMWRACPHAKAVPGVRVAYTDEREIQHAMDLGALVIVVPTIRSVAEGTAARDWAYFPPLGKRSSGGGQAFDPDIWGNVPGGLRQTINDNVVLIEMIETLDGARDAREIAADQRRRRRLRSQRRPG